MGACVAAHETSLQSLIQRAESDAATRVCRAPSLYTCVPASGGWLEMTLSSKLCAACEVSLGPEQASHSLCQATPIMSLLAAVLHATVSLHRLCLAGHRCDPMRPEARQTKLEIGAWRRNHMLKTHATA